MQAKLRESLTCAICLGLVKDPRLLPCHHSFCRCGQHARARGGSLRLTSLSSAGSAWTSWHASHPPPPLPPLHPKPFARRVVPPSAFAARRPCPSTLRRTPCARRWRLLTAEVMSVGSRHRNVRWGVLRWRFLSHIKLDHRKSSNAARSSSSGGSNSSSSSKDSNSKCTLLEREQEVHISTGTVTPR